jgi:hypothetical protein
VAAVTAFFYLRESALTGLSAQDSSSEQGDRVRPVRFKEDPCV